VLDVSGVSKTFDGKRAVDGVSFSVARGEIFGLLGPNGAGKTTLIRMMMDILRPDEGRILLLGREMGPDLQDRLGYLPEERGLYQRQRVADVLVFLGEIKGLPPHVARARADRYLDRVGLLASRGRKMRELSKGMQQKIQIAAVLQHEPDLIVLDEPFIGLDPVNREVVLELLRETVARGASIVLSTHLMEQVEALCTRAVMLHHGRVVLSGTVREIKERHADNAVVVECDRDLSAHAAVARAEGGRLFLRDGVTPETFLASLLADGAAVRRFERALPSLHDVFVRVVKDGVI
jgi:ABC-2 type transport system ATP-binding protein